MKASKRRARKVSEMRLETIYLVHHSHTDVGYTHDQPIVWELYRRFLDAAIDAGERDLDTDADWAMRWTVETTAPLLHWLQIASDWQVERFLRLAKAGCIEVTAMFANLTPLCDTDELIESLQPLHRLRTDFGLEIRHAMNCDVNGHNGRWWMSCWMRALKGSAWQSTSTLVGRRSTAR